MSLDEALLMTTATANGLRLMCLYQDNATFKSLGMNAVTTVALSDTVASTVNQAVINFNKLTLAKARLVPTNKNSTSGGPCGGKPCTDAHQSQTAIGAVKSVAQTTASLTQAAVALLKHDYVAPDVYFKRVIVCHTCQEVDGAGVRLPRLDKNLRLTCGSFIANDPLRDQKKSGCGCYLDTKMKLNGAECPRNKW